MRRRIELIGGTFEPWPSFDTAVTRALLLDIAGGEIPESMRLYQPRPTVAFGRQDLVRPGFATAARRAREEGFNVTQRLTGTRTVAYHAGCVVVQWAVPDPEPFRRLAVRYMELANSIAAALRRFDVDTRIGEVRGEPAPGMYSVNVEDRAKLATIDQRAIDGAALLTSVVVIRDAVALRDVLLEVNEALDFEWDTAALGCVEEEVGAEVEVADVGDAIVAELSERYETSEGQIADRTLRLAHALEPEHRQPALTLPERQSSGS